MLDVQGMRVGWIRAHGLSAESASLGAAGRGWSVCVSVCVLVGESLCHVEETQEA